MTYGGYHAYRVSQDLAVGDPPFASLIFAAMRKADTQNTAILKTVYPELYAEMQKRYWAPGGMIDTD